MMNRYFQGRIMGAVMLVVLLTTFVGLSRSAVHAVAGDWPMYLADLARDGFNRAETIINRTTAPNLKIHWMHQSGGQVASQPVEANGLIYWGSWDGLEHASDPSTGTDRWAVNLGQTSSCLPYRVGVQSTATVSSVPLHGVSTPVVFVGGGQAQLYALDANSGAVIWKIRLGDSPAHFLYSSPAVFKGSVYMGVASSNDCPLVQGQMVQVNASTGRLQHIFNVVPTGCTGGGVWGSPAVDTATGKLYFATGNRGQCSQSTPYTTAVVELNAADLSLVAAWQIPPSELLVDGDFGSTPTLFQATMGGVLHKLLGLVNKNGLYYALDRTTIGAGPLWEVKVAEPGPSPDGGKGSISSSAWDESRLYVATGVTTVQGAHCAGSLRALNPTNGTLLWEDCLPGRVLGPVSAVPGVVVVGGGSHMYLVEATTGHIRFNFHDSKTNSMFWGPASISHGVLYEGNMDGILYAFGL